MVVERCQGISVGSEVLSNHTTHEMTAGEMKFHLRCETLLNAVKDPEFRSLVVEAIMILIKVGQNCCLRPEHYRDLYQGLHPRPPSLPG